MKNTVLVAVLTNFSIVFSCLAATAGAQMGMAGKGTMVHDYAPIQVPANLPVPQLALSLHRDAMSGVNLHLKLHNYTLGPPEKAKVAGQLNGHAHLYVNGKKIQRLYGPDVHIAGEHLRAGINLVMVSLNDHSHAVWQLGNKQLLASSFINLDSDTMVLHSFSSVPPVW